jgi:hypothetical protein
MIEVLKQMVEALEWCHGGEPIGTAEAIKVGKQAIAELESQEPRNVRERWNVEFDGNDLLVCFNDHEKGDKCQYERYSPQRTWVGLTDEEVRQMCGSVPSMKEAVREAEAKLKGKNT